MGTQKERSKQGNSMKQEPDRMQEVLNRQAELVEALVGDYENIYHIDMDQDSFLALRVEGVINLELYGYDYEPLAFSESVRKYVEDFVQLEDRALVLEMTNPNYMRDRLMRDRRYSFVARMLAKHGHEYYEFRLVGTGHLENQNSAILAIRNVDRETREELRRQREMWGANEKLKTMVASAVQVNQVMVDILSRISHDIRTPMNAILGMAAIASSCADDREKVQDCLQKITNSGQNLLGIINEILDMSLIEGSSIKLSVGRLSLPEMFYEVFEMIGPQIRERRQRFRVSLNGIRHETIFADKDRLQQVFFNVLENAVKYTYEGGHITISITEKPSDESDASVYEFVFEDDGIGMNEELQERIFNPFVKREHTDAGKIQGVGLGMVISKRIIDLMGGTITVESRPNIGSKFIIVLPVKVAGDALPDMSELAGQKVLVLDRDDHFRDTISSMIRELGLEVVAVDNVTTAFLQISQGPFFAALLDFGSLDERRRVVTEIFSARTRVIMTGYRLGRSVWDPTIPFIDKPIFMSGLARALLDVLHPNHVYIPRKNGMSLIAQNNFSSRRVLLVEDNDLNRELAMEIIGSTGAAVEMAKDGEEAVEMMKHAQSGYYDLILMDLQMPNKNGYEAAAEIRAMDDPGIRSIPIVAMTANTFPEDIKRVHTVGMDGHLAKPINFKQLNDVLNRWLK